MENLFEKHMIQTISSITAITDESVEMSMDTDPETMYEIMRTYGLNFGQMTANAVAYGTKTQALEIDYLEFILVDIIH